MSRNGGRGRGFGRGRHGNTGGRGGYRNDGHSSKKNNNSATKSKSKLEDHMHHVGSAQQASDYVTNANFIINCMKKSYDMGGDAGQALEKLEHPIECAAQFETRPMP